MATANQVLALLRSHVEGDEEQLYSIALQLAATEAKRGRSEMAEALRAVVAKARQRDNTAHNRRSSPTSLATPRGELAALLQISQPSVKLNDMVLPDGIASLLKGVVGEQRQRARLREFGQRPSANLMLIGPPGSGKTMTASAIAGELGLSLFTVKFDTLITRFLGETAAQMRRIFDEIARQRAVYLFDEFDALGSRRDRDNDVGEMRRVLNSFLQFIEETNSTDSLVIATTNYPGLLDHALLRRFDEVVRYDLPDELECRAIVSRTLGSYGKRLKGWSMITSAAIGLSHAEVSQAAKTALKQAILSGEDAVDSMAVQTALISRQDMRINLDQPKQ